MTKADNSKERLEDAMQSLSSLGIPLVKTWGSVRFINTIGRKLWSVNHERNGLPKGHTRSHPTPTRGRDGRSSCRGWGWASAGVDEVLKPGMVAASDAWRKPMECDSNKSDRLHIHCPRGEGVGIQIHQRLQHTV